MGELHTMTHLTTGQLVSGAIVFATVVALIAVLLPWRGWFPRRPKRTHEQLAEALKPSTRRLTPFRHAAILEHLKMLARQVDGASEKVKGPQASGDAATLYLAMRWLVPITEELLLEHAKISPALTPEEEAPRDKLNERYRPMAAGAFGMAKPQGDRPVV